MFKKVFSIMLLVFMLIAPISVFASEDTTTAVVSLDGVEGQYIGTSTANSDSTNKNQPDGTVTPQTIYWAQQQVVAKVVGSSTVEANFTITSNTAIYSMFQVAELQRYEDGSWIIVDTKSQPFDINPATKTPKGQFNFYNVTTPGNYRVLMYGDIEARDAKFSMIKAPYSNTVHLNGGIEVYITFCN